MVTGSEQGEQAGERSRGTGPDSQAHEVTTSKRSKLQCQLRTPPVHMQTSLRHRCPGPMGRPQSAVGVGGSLHIVKASMSTSELETPLKLAG